MEFPSDYTDLGSGTFLTELLAQASHAPLPLTLVEYVLDYWLDVIGAQE